MAEQLVVLILPVPNRDPPLPPTEDALKRMAPGGIPFRWTRRSNPLVYGPRGWIPLISLNGVITRPRRGAWLWTPVKGVYGGPNEDE